MQRFKSSCAYKLFTTISIFSPNSKLKRAKIPRKLKELEYPGNMHCYSLCPRYRTPTKFPEIPCSSLRGVALTKNTTDRWTDQSKTATSLRRVKNELGMGKKNGTPDIIDFINNRM